MGETDAGDTPSGHAPFPQVYGRYAAEDALRHEHRTNEWPGPWALSAAALLHGIALLVVAVLAERMVVPAAPLQAFPVTLLVAPEAPPARPADSVPELALLAAPADRAVVPSTGTDVAGPVAAEDMSAPKRERAPGDTGRPLPIMRRLPQGAAAVADHRTKKSAKKILPPESADAVAIDDAATIYEVLMDADGSIRAVAVMRSSGVQSFDDAGKKMIYHDIPLPPPSHEPTTLRVTLHFSREGADGTQRQ